MKNRQLIVVLLLAVYVLVVAGFTVIYVENSADYFLRDGSETINYIVYLFLSSLILQCLVWFVGKTFDLRAIALSTLGNLIASVLVALVIMSVLNLNFTPRHLIFLFCGNYMIFLAVIVVAQSRRLK